MSFRKQERIVVNYGHLSAYLDEAKGEVAGHLSERVAGRSGIEYRTYPDGTFRRSIDGNISFLYVTETMRLPTFNELSIPQDEFDFAVCGIAVAVRTRYEIPPTPIA